MLTWISPKESPDHVHSKFNFLYKYQHLEPKKYGHDFFPEKISYVVNPCEFFTLGALKCWKVPFRRWGGYTIARPPPAYTARPLMRRKNPRSGGINMFTGQR